MNYLKLPSLLNNVTADVSAKDSKTRVTRRPRFLRTVSTLGGLSLAGAVISSQVELSVFEINYKNVTRNLLIKVFYLMIYCLL